MIVAGLELTRIDWIPSSRRARQACVPGVVELRRLPDHDRAGADDQNLLDVVCHDSPLLPLAPAMGMLFLCDGIVAP